MRPYFKWNPSAICDDLSHFINKQGNVSHKAFGAFHVKLGASTEELLQSMGNFMRGVRATQWLNEVLLDMTQYITG